MDVQPPCSSSRRSADHSEPTQRGRTSDQLTLTEPNSREKNPDKLPPGPTDCAAAVPTHNGTTRAHRNVHSPTMTDRLWII